MTADDATLSSVHCKDCGIEYAAYTTPSDSVELDDGRRACRCGGTDFLSWTEKLHPSLTDDS